MSPKNSCQSYKERVLVTKKIIDMAIVVFMTYGRPIPREDNLKGLLLVS
jgi:hypothetical protein